MNRLNIEQRAKILGCMVEGNSVRSTSRITGADKKTVLRLLAEFGEACKKFHDEKVRNVKSLRVQCDEIWSFVYAKEKNVPEQCKGQFGFGDVWTWTALDADSKLILSYRVDRRDEVAAHAFIDDLRGRLANRVQLTADGHHAYLVAVNDVFGADVDFAQLVKLYSIPKTKEDQRRYSPGECCGIRKRKIIGQPAKKDISTSYVERMNLNIRMGSRRFTRLTNAFSKKVENHIHAMAVYFAYYNFCRVHQSLRVTPAMEAGLTDHVWTLEELAALAGPVKKALETADI
ncbi:MAG: IS1 family transposase [Burkholderiales bacterium]